MSGKLCAERILVQGVVQGVGFRPFIYNLAARFQLTGWVRNTSSGVEIEVTGVPSALASFLDAVRREHPPLARIDDLQTFAIPPFTALDFQILASQAQPGDFIPISPDISTCPDCQRELFDPLNRRFRYPFINCTNCGPRFTIIQDIPYDRPKTTMSGFAMCPACLEEYENPVDRRFHAQPIACPQCGPQLSLQMDGKLISEGEAALQAARRLLTDGKILSVKGLGGYHLACDAGNSTAVSELRRRKKRSDKPFALMAFSSEIIQKHCTISAPELTLLESRPRPIVLLERLAQFPLAEDLAPRQHTLGFMLPYAPLHLLLLEPAPNFPEVLVMTSGNLSEEPIAYEDEDALNRLSPLADAFLLHDRPIHIRTDDSVARLVEGKPYLLRRSRGYAPDAIHLPVEVPPILAVGAELKNSFCLARSHYGFLSHFIGDMENYETYRSFEEGIQHFEHLFHTQPQYIACDLHPDYLATRYAETRAERENLPLFHIQHHHAHLAACLADNQWNSPEPVIGLSFDGTGLGTDGTIWGGEFLVGGYKTCQRAYHLLNTPLPGGDTSIRKPSRIALAHLWQANMDWDSDLPPLLALSSEERAALRSQLDHHLNSPLTSSMGRLFDAASALIGVCQHSTYEGQPAIELEALVDPSEKGYYDFDICEDAIDPAPLWRAMIQDLRKGVPLPVLAARFHNSVIHLSVEVCTSLRLATDCVHIALSGGVWQNKVLLTGATQQLTNAGFKVLIHHQVPANDGCIALGQALIAAYQIKE